MNDRQIGTEDGSVVLPPSLDELLRAEHIVVERDEVLRSRLQSLMTSMWSRKDVKKPFGKKNKVAQGVVLLTGESGSGKSKTALAALTALRRPDGSTLLSKSCVINMPSPYSSKNLARAIIAELMEVSDQELDTKAMSDADLWAVARDQMSDSDVELLFVDESARWATMRTVGPGTQEKELRILADNLNECTMHKEWPVAVVVAGLPSLGVLWKTGALGQIRRRTKFVALKPLTPGTMAQIATALETYARIAGVKLGMSDAFEAAARITHAASRVAGVAFEICRDAAALAAGSEEKLLRAKHLQQVYAERSESNEDGRNVFKVTDWRGVEVRPIVSLKDLNDALEKEREDD